jgi:hypothetical protein
MRTYEVHAIAGLPDKAFTALVESGAVSKADIAAVRALRAGRTAKSHEVTIRKREEPKMETMVEKVERSERVQKNLTEAIVDYAKRHGVSTSVAADKVLLSPAMSQFCRLDRDLHNAEHEAVARREMRKAERSAKEVQFDDMVNSEMKRGLSRSMAYKTVIESKTGAICGKKSATSATIRMMSMTTCSTSSKARGRTRTRRARSGRPGRHPSSSLRMQDQFHATTRPRQGARVG